MRFLTHRRNSWLHRPGDVLVDRDLATFESSLILLTTKSRGPSCGLKMDGTRGWLVGAGHPDPSLTRFSDVKTFDRISHFKPVLR